MGWELKTVEQPLVEQLQSLAHAPRLTCCPRMSGPLACLPCKARAQLPAARGHSYEVPIFAHGNNPDTTLERAGVLPPNDSLDPTGSDRSPYPVALMDVVMRFGTTPDRRVVLRGCYSACNSDP